MVKRISITVSGRVQGVGYRYFAQEAAEALEITGWASNQFNRTVELEAQGEQQALDLFCSRLREGPPLAHVADLRVCEMSPITGETTFEVRS